MTSSPPETGGCRRGLRAVPRAAGSLGLSDVDSVNALVDEALRELGALRGPGAIDIAATDVLASRLSVTELAMGAVASCSAGRGRAIACPGSVRVRRCALTGVR